MSTFAVTKALESRDILLSHITQAKTPGAHEQAQAHAQDRPHAERVGEILAQLNMDENAVTAGVLHGLGFNAEQRAEIESTFNADVLHLLDESAKISAITMKCKTQQQADSVRKMIFALIDDIRVIIIKLADKLDRMRNLKGVDTEKQRKTAYEALNIWAPIANRLGISSLKDELEDLSLKFSNPDVFAQIKKIVALKKGERAEYLERAINAITQTAAQNGISVTVKGRAKHFYSIYQKMRKRNKAADELYDLLAVRVLCKNTVDCYTIIGLVHTLWQPLDGRFKDYIAKPKENGYQSLHTAVLCDDKPLEIQIRTFEMHEMAENGVASHWLYKKGTNKDAVDEKSLDVVNKIKELAHEVTATKDSNNATQNEHESTARVSAEKPQNKNRAPTAETSAKTARADATPAQSPQSAQNAFFAAIKQELLGKSVFVFTPRGDVIELAAGSCAIDFAYAIHSTIGEKITAAKADGQIIPLASALSNTQTVEIITNPNAHPTVNQLSYVKTSKARAKIRAWLNEHDATFATHSRADDADTVAQTHAPSEGAPFAHHRPTHEQYKRFLQEQAETPEPLTPNITARIRIGDTSNILFSFARCCAPVFGDDVIGYVSRGRGIIVHKESCPNVWKIPNIAQRLIAVEWDTAEPKTADKNKK